MLDAMLSLSRSAQPTGDPEGVKGSLNHGAGLCVSQAGSPLRTQRFIAMLAGALLGFLQTARTVWCLATGERAKQLN